MRGPANAIPTSEPVIAHPLPTHTCRRASDVFVRRTPRSLVILAPGSALPVRVSGSAVDVWEMLATPRTAGSLQTELGPRAGVARGAVGADLAAALAVLVEAGAVVVTP
jgi:hypothetical protein